jgi:uncharacterized membrane protein
MTEKLVPAKEHKLVIMQSESKGPFKPKRTFGQRASDKMTGAMGSWGFLFTFFSFLVIWVAINAFFLVKFLKFGAFDPYPFILLNLFLSCLAAFQAPVILMSQNRQTEKDRKRFEYDYAVNRKAEKEIADMQKDLEIIKDLIKTVRADYELDKHSAKSIRTVERDVKQLLGKGSKKSKKRK